MPCCTGPQTQESTGESYLLDGRNSDDEEEREPARHWTCGCVDDQLWGQEPGSHLENTPSPTPASTYLKHFAGALLALQPGQEGHCPVLVTIVLRETPWLRGVVKEAMSARGEGTHVTLDTLVHLVHSTGATRVSSDGAHAGETLQSFIAILRIV